jgi:PncC family amidohydrolase
VGFTTGQEFHPAPKISVNNYSTKYALVNSADAPYNCPMSLSSAARTAHAYLRTSKKTIAIAESCTGGLLAASLTAYRGASVYLIGAMVTYHNSAKTRWLGIPARDLRRFGAVSAHTACAMARAIRQRSGADIGIAITGIAGPGGGSAEKPVGTVYWAVADKRKTLVQHALFQGTRTRIRTHAACAALALLRTRL